MADVNESVAGVEASIGAKGSASGAKGSVAGVEVSVAGAVVSVAGEADDADDADVIADSGVVVAEVGCSAADASPMDGRFCSRRISLVTRVALFVPSSEWSAFKMFAVDKPPCARISRARLAGSPPDCEIRWLMSTVAGVCAGSEAWALAAVWDCPWRSEYDEADMWIWYAGSRQDLPLKCCALAAAK